MRDHQEQVHHAFLAALSGLCARITYAKDLIANLGKAKAIK